MTFEQLISHYILDFSKMLEVVMYYNVLSLFGITETQFPLLIFFIICTALFLLIKFRFMNLRYFIYGLKVMFNQADIMAGQDKQNVNKIASLKAVFMAIAGATGLGSIAGVALAIAVGGPGSLVWIILMPFFCMPIRFAEVFLGHKYRTPVDNGFDGGPHHFIKKGLAEIGLKKLGIVMSGIFSICLMLAAFGGPCSFQVNQAISVLSHNFSMFGDMKIPLTLAFCGIAAFVLTGGIKRVAGLLSAIVPIVIALYFGSAIIVIIFNYKAIPSALYDIFTLAFAPHSVYGGILGAFVMGATRAIVASEIGLGTASIVHANVINKDSVKEGLTAMAAPIIEILFVSSITGLLVTLTGVYKTSSMGAIDVYRAFETVSWWFKYIVVCIIPVMGLNVMIAWGFFGERITAYYFGKKTGKIFLVLYIFAGFIGGIINNVDVMIAFLNTITVTVVFPNLIGVLLLSGVIWKEFKIFNKTI